MQAVPPPPPPPSAFPPDRYGAYERTIEDLAGPVDALVLADGAVLVVERDADRLTRIAPDGARARFGPDDLDAPEDVAWLPGGGFAVADTGNDRVLLLDAQGGVVRAIAGGRDVLHAPTGVAASATTLYVADPRNGRVARFALGAPAPAGGREPGAALARASAPIAFLDGLSAPVAVELGPDGEVFVLETGRHQVVVFGPDGARRRAFGDFGPHAGFLGHPRDLAIALGRVHVADADNHRVQVFDLAGRYVYEWGKHALRPREGEGSLHYPSGIELAGDRALVCEAFQDRVQVFARTEEDPARFITDPGIVPWETSPHFGPDVAVQGDLLAILEPETQTVLLRDLELDEPVEVARFGAYGDGPGRFRDVADLIVERDPWTVLVSDRATSTLSTFALDHEPDAPLKMDPRMASFARSARALPTGSRLGAIARVWDGALAAVDEASGAVLVLQDGAEPRALARLDEPVDLAFAGGVLLAVDRGARRVVALARDGSERWQLADLGRPRGVAAAPDGEIYVTDEVGCRVLRFTPTPGADNSRGAPRLAGAFGTRGLGPGELYRPAGIALDARDRVIVLDHGNHRGMIFDRAGAFLLAFGPRGYVKPTRAPR